MKTECAGFILVAASNLINLQFDFPCCVIRHAFAQALVQRLHSVQHFLCPSNSLNSAFLPLRCPSLCLQLCSTPILFISATDLIELHPSPSLLPFSFIFHSKSVHPSLNAALSSLHHSFRRLSTCIHSTLDIRPSPLCNSIFPQDRLT